jgi:protein gp37
MSDRSAIEWTDATWNPVRGCTKISPGCKHCYAETLAERFRGVPGHPFEHGFDLRLVPEKLFEPFRWVRSRHVFVNSMSDLFHEEVPDVFIHRVFSVMRSADWHIYQVLTKRPERMRLIASQIPWLSSARHIWLGVSVEDRKYGLPRVDELRVTKTSLRFLSIEPLLEDLGEFDLGGMQWVIVGGESGANARPIEQAWVRSLRDRCNAAEVPFFFKQWGGTRKATTGRKLDGRIYDEMPDISIAPAPTRTERVTRMETIRLVRSKEDRGHA